ncbi:uncharacterized protein LOC113027148 isoform X2 [Astatotilapia calliptera]|uniref:uncharacterized protein LOC113027148 isoform X2 n=1 Tax=Astatotilapia calliptera TaxID=8154 RepID=UPI000E40C55D|nr:uncharacterized protein LOC113027148 isoform X2 [Astatotilapia calliptera]
MHLIVRKRQPKSCWSRQDTNSPELCMNGTSGTFSTQERFILRLICPSYYPAVPLSCLNLQQESRSPHMTPGAEVLSQPPSDQLMSDTPTSFFQQTPGAEVLSQPPSDQLVSDTPTSFFQQTPSAEVLSQPPSDQLMSDTPTSFFQQTPGAEVLPQPPSDQLAQGPSILGVPSHTLYSAALDNMKGTSGSITLNNKNISNTSPRRAGTVRSKWTNDEVKVAERHVSLHKKLQSTR